MRCDASKVEKAIGWRPEIPIERTLQDLLNYWRETIVLNSWTPVNDQLHLDALIEAQE
jgi:dTDP-D-glucose 4,6-dehydratase